MEEIMEDEDSDVGAESGTGPPVQRKGISYSQPLDRDAIINSVSSRRRKHSFDDDCIYTVGSSSNASINPFNESAGHDVCGGGGVRSLSYPQYHSSPPPSLLHRHSSSEDGRFSHQNHPPLPPHNQYHQGGGDSSFAPYSFDRRKGGGGSSFDSECSFTLERAMSEHGGSHCPLPEFVGSGGDTGIFRVPLRAAVHRGRNGRPPALELRPHPLRETQAGSFLRTIICAGSQFWAGQESRMRVWNLDDVFKGWAAVGATPKRGDEESAPFRESNYTTPTLCLAVDAANGLIWSGHKDGKIRSWKMEQATALDSCRDDRECANNSGGAPSFIREGLSWQAHSRSPVLSMVITSYGNFN